jgi:CRP-like cAMP-binding protein
VTTARRILFLIIFIVEEVVSKGRQRLGRGSVLQHEKWRRRDKANPTFIGEKARSDNARQNQNNCRQQCNMNRECITLTANSTVTLRQVQMETLYTDGDEGKDLYYVLGAALLVTNLQLNKE